MIVTLSFLDEARKGSKSRPLRRPLDSGGGGVGQTGGQRVGAGVMGDREQRPGGRGTGSKDQGEGGMDQGPDGRRTGRKGGHGLRTRGQGDRKRGGT